MDAMILCAGLGTRFLPTTEKVAKTSIPFLNVPLLGYSLFEIEKLKPKNVVINTHHLPKSVESTAHALAAGHSLCFSHESEILGSGGGVCIAKQYLISDRGDNSGEFIVANGDEIILFAHDKGFAPLLDFHRKTGALATLLTTVHPEAGRTMGGVWADRDGRITRLGEKSAQTVDGQTTDAQHFVGVFVFSPKIFAFMPKSAQTSGVPKAFHIFDECLLPAIRAGEKVMAYQDRELLWLDATSVKAFIASTERALNELENATPYGKRLLEIQRRYGHEMSHPQERQWLANGAKFSGSLNDGAHLFMGKNSKIAAGVDVKRFAIIGEGATFAQGVIDSSIIAANVHVNELVGLRSQVLV